MQIHVEPGTSVISLAPYRVPDRLKEGVRSELDSLLDAGIIESSTSSWSAPLVPVVKPDGCLRLCVDFRCHNSVTP